GVERGDVKNASIPIEGIQSTLCQGKKALAITRRAYEPVALVAASPVAPLSLWPSLPRTCRAAARAPESSCPSMRPTIPAQAHTSPAWRQPRPLPLPCPADSRGFVACPPRPREASHVDDRPAVSAAQGTAPGLCVAAHFAAVAVPPGWRVAFHDQPSGRGRARGLARGL